MLESPKKQRCEIKQSRMFKKDQIQRRRRNVARSSGIGIVSGRMFSPQLNSSRCLILLYCIRGKLHRLAGCNIFLAVRHAIVFPLGERNPCQVPCFFFFFFFFFSSRRVNASIFQSWIIPSPFFNAAWLRNTVVKLALLGTYSPSSTKHFVIFEHLKNMYALCQDFHYLEISIFFPAFFREIFEIHEISVCG